MLLMLVSYEKNCAQGTLGQCFLINGSGADEATVAYFATVQLEGDGYDRG